MALLGSVAATTVVCADEIAASVRAHRWLATELRSDAHRRSRDAMVAAGSAYVLGGLGQLAVLVGWHDVTAQVVGEAGLLHTPSHLAVWLVVAVTPLVLARSVLVAHQVLAPEPVPSELDLWALLSREAKWETACALGVVGMVAALLMLPTVAVRRIRGVRPVARVRYLRPARDDVPEAMLAMWSNPPWYLRVAWALPLAYLPLVSIVVFQLVF